MLSTRVRIRNPIRDPLKSLPSGSYTHLNAKTLGSSLTNATVLLGKTPKQKCQILVPLFNGDFNVFLLLLLFCFFGMVGEAF